MRRGPNISASSSAASAHRGSRHPAAFPNASLLAPHTEHFVSCQLFSRAHSQRTPQALRRAAGTSRSAAHCWEGGALRPLGAGLPVPTQRRLEEDRGPAAQRSQVAGRNEGMIPPYAAHVNHGSVIRHLYGLADAGFSSFHHL